MDDLFIHEDTSKPENRINLSLFGALCVPAFRAWFHARLGLPASVAIYPTTNVVGDGGSIRPDFVVKADEAAPPLAWIEVECGHDEAQLARFRAQLGQRVIAVWGRAEPHADLGLDEVAAFIDGANLDGEHPQVRCNLRHLRMLIGEALDGPAARGYKVAPVSPAMLDTPLVRALRAVLGEGLSFDVARAMRPGEIRAQTIGERGLSVRVHSRVAADRSVSVLSQGAGRPEVTFPSRAKLERYLPARGDAIARFAALIGAMGGDVDGAEMEQRTPVPLLVVERRAAEVAALVRELGGVDGPPAG